MNPFARATAAMQRTLRKHAGVRILYRTPDGELPLVATVGTTQHTTEEATGTFISHESRDYLVAASEMVQGGEPLIPDPTHTLVEVDTGLEYGVLDLQGAPCWRWSDPHRLQMRIHTKLLGSE